MQRNKRTDDSSRASAPECLNGLKAWRDYLSFVFFCFLLYVPIYAIARSALKHDWVMMILDAVLVPVGFVHGLLMLFGFVE